MKYILNHKGNGQYDSTPPIGEKDYAEFEKLIVHLKKQDRYPYGLTEQPRKIVFIPHELINFIT